MKRTVAAEKLVGALVESRLTIHDGERAAHSSANACRRLHLLRKPVEVIPGGEIVALLAATRAYVRAAGNR
jgi:hypothetical protein